MRRALALFLVGAAAADDEACAAKRLAASLEVVADSWAFRYPTAPRHGQLDGVLSHAMPEPNVETKLDRICLKLFRDEPDATLVDVGANTGQTVTRLLDAWAGANAKPHIIAFEPGRNTFDALKNRGAQRRWPETVTLINAAVSNAPGEVSFEVSGTSQNGHIDLSAPARGGSSVHVTTVDEFLRARRVRLVHFLKIDTEGFEKLVLQGAAHYLREKRVRVLQFEYGLNWFAAYAAEVP